MFQTTNHQSIFRYTHCQWKLLCWNMFETWTGSPKPLCEEQKPINGWKEVQYAGHNQWYTTMYIYMYIFTHIHGASFQCHSSSLFPRTILNPMQLQKIIVSLPHLCHQPKNNKWLIGEIPPEKKSHVLWSSAEVCLVFSVSHFTSSRQDFLSSKHDQIMDLIYPNYK